jgi:hypothetical protein
MANPPAVTSEAPKGSATAPVPPWKLASLEGRYDELTIHREPFLERARKASKFTIPSLLPPQGHTGASKLYSTWQSIGARGVNNLAAKLLLALLPPNTPFFRFVFDQRQLAKLEQGGQKGADLKTNIEEGLSKYEKEIMIEIETGKIRVSAFETMLHLIVAGNVLCFLPLSGGMKVYHLDSYVVVRDGMGTVLEIIAEEKLSPQTVPQEIRKVVSDRCTENEKIIRMHTVVRREDNRYVTYQEVKGIEIPGSRGHYALDASPFIALRWIIISGEDYGRGHIEGLQGDLGSVEGLTQSIVEGSAAAAKMLILVNPNGITKQKTIAEAPNGAIRTGNAADVTVVQSQKAMDLRIAKETRSEVKQDLEASLLMMSSIQRNGERVTATEITRLAQELEGALGGVYALLAQEFQLPLVMRLIAQMIKQKRLKPLPKGFVRPTIVTGLEALSRGNDLQRLDLFMQGVEKYGPDAVQTYVNFTDLFTRRATALSIDQKGLIRTKEEVAEMRQQQQQAAMMQSVLPQGVKAVGDVAKESAKANAQGSESEAA